MPRVWVWWLSGKESACDVGDVDSIPGLGRSPGGKHGNPVQHPCLESPTDMRLGRPQCVRTRRSASARLCVLALYTYCLTYSWELAFVLLYKDTVENKK